MAYCQNKPCRAWLTSETAKSHRCATTVHRTDRDKARSLQASVPKRRAGQESEAILYAQMRARWPEWSPDSRVPPKWMRQFPFGSFLEPPRGFAFDAAFPAERIAVEVDGGAHAASVKQFKRDRERRGLAGAAGWIVVAVSPEEVRDGTAMERVTAALLARTTT